MVTKQADPVPETASDLAAQLRTVVGRLRHRMREQGGSGDLTPSQISVLLRLEQEGASTVSGMARAEGIRPQSMSSIVLSLQATGLVDSSNDPNDGRQTLLSLSRKCERLLRDKRAAKQDWLTSTILQRLSVQEQRRLSAAIKLLKRLADEGTSS